MKRQRRVIPRDADFKFTALLNAVHVARLGAKGDGSDDENKT